MKQADRSLLLRWHWCQLLLLAESEADRATGQKYTDAVIRIALTLNSLDLRGFMN